MNLRELYNLIEMIPEAGMEYISTRLVAPNDLTKDERKMLSSWVSKNQKLSHPQVIKDILFALDYGNIRFVANPDENESLKAIYSDPYLIEFIDNPNETIQMAAVKGAPFGVGRIFNLIKNPSHSAWLAVIAESPEKIRGMTSPHIDLQETAIRNKPSLITDQSVEWDPTIQSLAFELDPNMFQFVINPTEDECWEALRHNPKFISEIKNPLDEMKAYAIMVA